MNSFKLTRPGGDLGRRCHPDSGSFHFQTNRDFVDFALPCYLHCRRLVFASQLIWKWNQSGFCLKNLSGLAFSKRGTGTALRRRSRTRQPSNRASATE